MTYEELMREFDEIVADVEALTKAKDLPLAEIVMRMARIQVREVKLLSYLVFEVERLKVRR